MVWTQNLNCAIKDQLERVFSRIAYKRDEGYLTRILLSPLYLLSLLYGAAVRVRLALFSSGLFNAREIGCKVISVGNVTVGGTGKTPTVEFIARSLKERGFRPAILSRGYKRKGKGICVVSNGKDLLLGPDEAGDEPYMLARRLRDVPVLVGIDRYEIGKYAVDNLSADIVILDDGFQHIRVKRDVDILLIDGEKGFGNGYLVPRGPLREPVSSTGRADILVITKAGPDLPASVKDVLSSNSASQSFKSSYKPARLLALWSKEEIGIGRLAGANVMTLCGIASPSSFINLVSALGGHLVCEESLADHYSYNLDDLGRIIEKARSSNADFVVTTEKDAVKLEQLDYKKGVPIYYLEIGLDMGGKEMEFVDSIISRISN